MGGGRREEEDDGCLKAPNSSGRSCDLSSFSLPALLSLSLPLSTLRQRSGGGVPAGIGGLAANGESWLTAVPPRRAEEAVTRRRRASPSPPLLLLQLLGSAE